MILAIDVGNSRIKWGLHDGDQWQSQGAETLNQLQSWATRTFASETHPAIRQVIISNVAGADIQQKLERILQSAGLNAHFIQAAPFAAGVTNGYAQITQLGSDRWAALIAAWHITQSTTLVVSAGTALTIDALSSQGHFLGGSIVPGFQMMKSALTSGTAQLSSQEGIFFDFPTNTGDAIHTGILNALCGAVRSSLAVLQQHETSMPKLLITGGDASLLQNALSGLGEISDNLVLDGLIVLAKEIKA